MTVLDFVVNQKTEYVQEMSVPGNVCLILRCHLTTTLSRFLVSYVVVDELSLVQMDLHNVLILIYLWNHEPFIYLFTVIFILLTQQEN